MLNQEIENLLTSRNEDLQEIPGMSQQGLNYLSMVQNKIFALNHAAADFNYAPHANNLSRLVTYQLEQIAASLCALRSFGVNPELLLQKYITAQIDKQEFVALSFILPTPHTES